MKYLGVNLPQDLYQLKSLNYDTLIKQESNLIWKDGI